MPSTLIVDDESDIRRLLRMVIEAANRGLSVSGEAVDGQDALERWRLTRPDVVVIDHRMPNMTGLEAAVAILAEKPDQHVVLFTAFLNSQLVAEAESVGVRACLSKDDMFRLPEVLWSLS